MRKILSIFCAVLFLSSYAHRVSAGPSDEFVLKIEIDATLNYSFYSGATYLVVHYEEIGNELANSGIYTFSSLSLYLPVGF